MAEIILSNGMTVQVDDEDYAYLAKFRWHALKCKRKGTWAYYARRCIKNVPEEKKILMHREILGVTDPLIEVDHRNGDGLDNRRQNLRPCTKSQNQHNQKPKRSKRFKGVGFHRPTGKFVAYIRADKVQRHLGVFANEIDAAKAYNVAALALFGEFARLNDLYPRITEKEKEL